MKGDDFTVTIKIPPTGRLDGCAVIVIGPPSQVTTIAQDLDFPDAVKLAYHVRGKLDDGSTAADIRVTPNRVRNGR